MPTFLDLRTQVRSGEDFTLLKISGGTGREDGWVPGTGFEAAVPSDVSAVTKGMLVKHIGDYTSGNAVVVRSITAATDRPIGVATEDIAAGESGWIAFSGKVLVLTTGTIGPGDVIYTSSTTGRASPTLINGATAVGISLMDTSGTSSGYAILVMMSVPALDYAQFRGAVNIVFGDGTNDLTTGDKGYLRWPFSGTIIRNSLFADASGSVVIDIYRDSYANFPPIVGDSITASAKPTLSGAQKSEDSTLTGWTEAFTEGDIYRFNVDSATTVKQVTLELKYERT